MRQLCMLVALLAAAPLFAQEPEKPVEAAAEIPADYAAYIRKVSPGADPTGEHSLFNLKDYTEKNKRHEYTGTMARLLLVYLHDLDMGATLSKLFDQYARGKYAENASFKVLHGVVLSQYPRDGSNLDQSEKIFRDAAERFQDFAYPWYYIANIEEVRHRLDPSRGVQPALTAINKALQIQPDFLQAISLKADLLRQYTQAGKHEAARILEPVLKGKLPTNWEDYSKLLESYFLAAGPDRFQELSDEHLKRPDFDDRLKIRLLTMQVGIFIETQRYDDAIRVLEEAEKLADPKEDPLAALQLQRFLATSWGFKAKRLLEADPSLQTTRKEFEGYLLAAKQFHEKAAKTDQVHMPIAKRGLDAEVYGRFLWDLAMLEMRKSMTSMRARADDAAKWLDNYLAETHLSDVRRRSLERVRATFGLLLNPTEDGYLDEWEKLSIENDVASIRQNLAVARDSVRQQKPMFKSVRALKFFIRMLESRDREIVRDAAFLAAETALRLDTEQQKNAGKAIADRFEKEKELNSAEQGDLLDDLCESIRRLSDSTSMERVLLHMATIAETSTESIKLREIMRGWMHDEFLRGVANAPEKMSRSQMGDAAAAAEWLRKLAEAVRKNREGS